MSQYGRPDSDVSSNGWIASSGTDLYAMIDEVTPSDTDYIYSTAPVNTDCVVGLSDVTDPSSSSGHYVRYRWRTQSIGGGVGDFTVRLMQGTSEIASWAHTSVGSQTQVTTTQTLTSGQADSITDYTALRFKFEGNKTAGTIWNIYVSWAEFETPDASGGASLTVADVAHSHALDVTLLTYHGSIVTADIAHAHSLDAVIVIYNVGLTVTDIQHSHALDAVVVIYTASLTVADIAHSHIVDPADLNVVYYLSVNDIQHSHVLDAVALTQKYYLSVSDIQHNHSIDAVALTQKYYLSVSDIQHSHSIDAVTVQRYYYPFYYDFTGADGLDWDSDKWVTEVAA